MMECGHKMRCQDTSFLLPCLQTKKPVINFPEKADLVFVSSPKPPWALANRDTG